MAGFTAEQEARIREIAREEAVRAAHALSRIQAAYAAGRAISQYRVEEHEIRDVAETGAVEGPFA